MPTEITKESTDHFGSEVASASLTDKKEYPFALYIDGSKINCLLAAKDKVPFATMQKKFLAFLKRPDLGNIKGPSKNKCHFGKAVKEGTEWRLLMDYNYHENAKLTETLKGNLAVLLGTQKDKLKIPHPDEANESIDSDPLNVDDLASIGKIEQFRRKLAEKIDLVKGDIASFVTRLIKILDDDDASSDPEARKLFKEFFVEIEEALKEEMTSIFDNETINKSFDKVINAKTRGELLEEKGKLLELFNGCKKKVDDSILSIVDQNPLDTVTISDRAQKLSNVAKILKTL